MASDEIFGVLSWFCNDLLLGLLFGFHLMCLIHLLQELMLLHHPLVVEAWCNPILVSLETKIALRYKRVEFAVPATF